VDCRIEVEVQRDGCTVYLAGRLKAEQVHELRGICSSADGWIRIDLTDLLSADAVGVDVLRRLQQDGVELVGVAHYLRRWLG
jgi:anti-anti-sigma regulatory factor